VSIDCEGEEEEEKKIGNHREMKDRNKVHSYLLVVRVVIK
jgi:hypothetical protein